jgi:cardiolipin synthase
MRLILQGEPDIPIVRVAARMLYHHLLLAGVSIFEYCERPMHAKVALTDDCWSTVGSSNLDPLSCGGIPRGSHGCRAMRPA